MPLTPIPNPTIGDNGAKAIKLVSGFIRERLVQHQTQFNRTGTSVDSSNAPASGSTRSQRAGRAPPLFVAIQGPQGSGKSHLVDRLPAALAPLRTATLSIDELYLPHADLVQLAEAHPENKLIQGRGQPGTHDLALGTTLFKQLKEINAEEDSNHSGRTTTGVRLPTYDKSLFDGQGDRSTEVVSVQAPIDIVLFEGWCVGFHSLPPQDLTSHYARAQQDGPSYAQAVGLDYEQPFFLQHRQQDLEWVNQRLKEYQESLWRDLDCFVMMEPEKMGYVWQWRLQQEHNMKAKNGGKGMTDEQVKDFIARYMPGYELFKNGIQDPQANWKGQGLKLITGREREIVATDEF